MVQRTSNEIGVATEFLANRPIALHTGRVTAPQSERKQARIFFMHYNSLAITLN